MSEMSDEARALFASARTIPEPSAEARDEVRRAVLRRVGAVALASAAARTADASASSALSGASSGAAAQVGVWGVLKAAGPLKTFVTFALVGSLSAVGVQQLAGGGQPAPSVPKRAIPSSAPAQPARTLPAEPARATPQPEPPQAAAKAASALSKTLRPRLATRDAPSSVGSALAARDAAVMGESAARERNAPTAAFTSLPPPAVGAVPASRSDSAAKPEPATDVTLNREAWALELVQRALREGNAARALLLLDQQDREFGRGKLGQERHAARVIALCIAGRVADARALAAEFLERSPRSPLAARLRATCADR